jgi:hypothetical protein
MTNESIDFGDMYLATNADSEESLDEVIELYLLVVRDPQKTLRKHGRIYLSQLEEGKKPKVQYCISVTDGKFVDLSAEPQGATPQEIKRLKLISRLSEHQKVLFKSILNEMESRAPGNLKFYEED